jgi:hypothetical protein
MSILTYIAGWPLLAALLLLFVPGNYRVIVRAIAVLATFISMVLAIKMFLQFNGAPVDADGYRFVEMIPWVDSLGISYHVGVDGLNVGLILMGAIVAFAATLCSWEIQTREKEFYILLLIMTAGILGTFASLDPDHALSEPRSLDCFGRPYCAVSPIRGKYFRHPQDNCLCKEQSSGGERSAFHFPFFVIWVWHFSFSLAFPLLGALGLWGCSGADGHVARWCSEEIRPLRFDPDCAAVDAASRPKLDASDCLARHRQHLVCRLGRHAPKGFEPFDR